MAICSDCAIIRIEAAKPVAVEDPVGGNFPVRAGASDAGASEAPVNG